MSAHPNPPRWIGEGTKFPISPQSIGGIKGGKTPVGHGFELKLTPMGNAVPLREIYMYQGLREMLQYLTLHFHSGVRRRKL